MVTKSQLLESHWMEFLKHIKESQETLQEHDPVERDFWAWFIKEKIGKLEKHE